MTAWIPLESNPEVLTKYSRSLGATLGEWVDVYGLSEDLLGMVPQPLHAVVLLFPITSEYDNFCKEEDQLTKDKGQVVSDMLYYMKQFVPNACGSVGVFHALLNNIEAVGLESGILKDFLDETKGLDPHGRGDALCQANKLAEAHESIAAEGQTAPPNPEEQIMTHFVTFVQKDGFLYELDGRRQFPINHGKSSAETLLLDAAKVCEQRIKLLNKADESGSEYRFSVVAYTTGTVE